MESVAGFPFLPLEMSRDGAADTAQREALLAALGGGLSAITDLIVISHGWNNDMAEARALYQALLSNMRGLLDAGRPDALAGRSFAVLGLYWPSKKFADEALKPEAVLAGGVAAFGDAVG